jgi:hypothetical protein
VGWAFDRPLAGDRLAGGHRNFFAFLGSGCGDIDFVDCEQAAGTVNACQHQLRYVNINVPGKKDLTIDNYQLKLVATTE